MTAVFVGAGATGGGGDHAHGQCGVDPDAVYHRDLQYFPARVPPGLLPGEGAGERGIPEPGGENRGAGIASSEVEGEACRLVVGGRRSD